MTAPADPGSEASKPAEARFRMSALGAAINIAVLCLAVWLWRRKKARATAVSR